VEALLAPALRRVKRLAHRARREVTAGRGYGDAKVDKDLSELGVRFVAIVRRGRESASRHKLERSSRFRKFIKFTGK
jgi:IS5 family transposase